MPDIELVKMIPRNHHKHLAQDFALWEHLQSVRNMCNCSQHSRKSCFASFMLSKTKFNSSTPTPTAEIAATTFSTPSTLDTDSTRPWWLLDVGGGNGAFCFLVNQLGQANTVVIDLKTTGVKVRRLKINVRSNRSRDQLLPKKTSNFVLCHTRTIRSKNTPANLESRCPSSIESTRQ